MARKDESAVKRLGSLVGPLFLAQLHSVKLKSLIFYYCQEERQCHCESRQKKHESLVFCVVRKGTRSACLSRRSTFS